MVTFPISFNKFAIPLLAINGNDVDDLDNKTQWGVHSLTTKSAVFWTWQTIINGIYWVAFGF